MGKIRMEDTSKLTECRTKSTMVSADEALRIVLSVAQRLPPVTLPLLDALGKILAEDIRAPDPLPPYPASVKVINFEEDYTLATCGLDCKLPQVLLYCFWLISLMYLDRNKEAIVCFLIFFPRHLIYTCEI